MYKVLTVMDRVRVDPSNFKDNVNESIEIEIMRNYENKLDENKFLLSLVEVLSIGEGLIIPGDGAIYYETTFKLLIYEPLIKEIVEGEVSEITEYGAFVKIGPIEGFIHMSQVMDDFVSFSKTKSLLGKESKKSLNIGDYVRARVIAVSMKNLKDAKIGLTMRQAGLGKIEWIAEQNKAEAKAEKKADKK
ncbi:MAG: DNA-directed RNA polymerase [Candidatus Nanoarchaeia archaeon]|nr:DNA-directed RNA polymerase [Candidatus Nanoarchaeia archaeon]MDD5054455.1 DNA-directed RNA polymerase [Candidatus Nanoarchaeia archaeon]MDD5499422.1 DNA-directed RNA polymerase [Candidatus Nanoarchaeia archaeon]